MLKIKDSIELDELEKFGFKKYRKNYIKDCIQSEFCPQRITVDARKTAKKFGSYGYIYGIYYYSNEPMLETIVELAEAGFIEKAVDNDN